MKATARILLATFALLAVAEILFRCAGYPKGTFAFAYQDANSGLHPPNMDFVMRISQWPFRVHSNNLGLRGNDVPQHKTAGTLRIAAIGDSFTYGFNVDEEATYPAQLQALLRQSGHLVDVLNVSRPGAALDNEYHLLKNIALPLQPDLIILGFTSNDLEGRFADVNIEDVVRDDPQPLQQKLVSATTWLLVHSAFLEQALEHWLRYASHGQFMSTHYQKLDDSRYVIDGMLDHEANIRRLQAAPQWEYAFVEKDLSRHTGKYEKLLHHFVGLAEKNRARILLVLIPSYIQTYDTQLDLKMNRWLQDVAGQNQIAFYDATSDFRHIARNEALYIYPGDIHMNPRGNAYLARFIGQYLLDHPDLLQSR